MADMERTREVYNFALRLIPHKKFTFAKMWLYAAKFEIRQKQLTAARKLLVSTVLFIVIFLQTDRSKTAYNAKSSQLSHLVVFVCYLALLKSE